MNERGSWEAASARSSEAQLLMRLSGMWPLMFTLRGCCVRKGPRPGMGVSCGWSGQAAHGPARWSYTTFTAPQLSLKKQRRRAFNVCIFLKSRLLGRDFKLAPVDGCPSGPERPDLSRSTLVWLVRDSKEDYIYCKFKNVNQSNTGINVISQQYRPQFPQNLNLNKKNMSVKKKKLVKNNITSTGM